MYFIAEKLPHVWEHLRKLEKKIKYYKQRRGIIYQKKKKKKWKGTTKLYKSTTITKTHYIWQLSKSKLLNNKFIILDIQK